jgi:predicted metal-dependent hydrolase
MPDKSTQTVLVEFSGEMVPVALERRERKCLSISVHPDGSVTAVAPRDRSLNDVRAHLQRRTSWIARQRRHFETFLPLPAEKRFISGETHLYLGRQYRLRVHCRTSASVKLVGRFLNVYAPEPHDLKVVRAAIDGWYRSHAEAIFRQRLGRCLEIAPSMQRADPRLRIRPMKRRWGSCSKAGSITLNSELVKMPLHCIEYVIMHELCHLRIHDHSPSFFRLLSRCMPDWERRKKRLDSLVLR